MTPHVPEPLKVLKSHFNDAGFDIKFVGGCVRDWLLSDGSMPDDIDLCTDANPDEQRAIYEQHNVRHIDTGLQHGTWTVVMNDETYEITSLRIDTDQDGRHATVNYTRDWLLDLSRRDLTFNAMLMDFDGTITDPYNGQEDLRNHVVKFVGNPEYRMREDYLRILRWYRFHARFSNGVYSSADVDTSIAIKNTMTGLSGISSERIWTEIKKTLSHPAGFNEFTAMIIRGIGEYIRMPTPQSNPSVSLSRIAGHAGYLTPIAIMAAYLGSRANVDAIARAWKWSNDELFEARTIVELLNFIGDDNSLLKQAKKMFAIDGRLSNSIVMGLRARNKMAMAYQFTQWSTKEFKPFPINGVDLKAIGFVEGRQMGEMLAKLKTVWRESDYKLTKESLLNTVEFI